MKRLRIQFSGFSLILTLLLSSAHLLYAQPGTVARYVVKMTEDTIPRLLVTASLPIRGDALAMEPTRPGDIPVILKEGWPALIRSLRISDEAGRPIETTSTSTKGWQLKQTHIGRLTLTYEVDYSVADSLGWPAPRETAFKDSTHLSSSAARSLLQPPRSVQASSPSSCHIPGWLWFHGPRLEASGTLLGSIQQKILLPLSGGRHILCFVQPGRQMDDTWKPHDLDFVGSGNFPN